MANYGRDTYAAAPGWFIERIHRGIHREKIRDKYDEPTLGACLATYDLLRQFTAAHAIERRGWLVDQFGRALTLDELPQVIRSRDFEYTKRALAILIEQKWLRRRKYAPLDPNQRGRDAAGKLETRRATLPLSRARKGTSMSEQVRSKFGVSPNKERSDPGHKAKRLTSKAKSTTYKAPDGGDVAAPRVEGEEMREKTADACTRLEGIGFDVPAAWALFHKHGAERCREALDNAEALAAAGKLSNDDGGRGLICVYLEKGWKPSAELRRAREKQAASGSEKTKRLAGKLDGLLEAYDREVIERIPECEWAGAFRAGCALLESEQPGCRAEYRHKLALSHRSIAAGTPELRGAIVHAYDGDGRRATWERLRAQLGTG